MYCNAPDRVVLSLDDNLAEKHLSPCALHKPGQWAPMSTSRNVKKTSYTF